MRESGITGVWPRIVIYLSNNNNNNNNNNRPPTPKIVPIIINVLINYRVSQY